MPYDVGTIQSAIQRLTGERFTKARLKTELDKVVWIPEVDRMIAVSNKESTLSASERYGVFREMSPSNEYITSIGRAEHARPLTAAEIAKCF